MELFDIINDKKESLISKLKKIFSSTNINFLIGAGCSSLVIDTLGNLETEINNEKDVKIQREKFEQFKKNIIIRHKNIVPKQIEIYKEFLMFINKILCERDNSFFPRRANIFTTNYDFFIETSSEDIPIILNDGFDRTKPKRNNIFYYSSDLFFNKVYGKGQLYNYEYEIPSINLIKLHGSISWREDEGNNKISFQNNFENNFFAIMPSKEKFETTVMNKYYYDLLRLYTNELNRENTILISMGFSFNDEHILEITKRELKNNTLNLILFCYDLVTLQKYINFFDKFNNVWIIYKNKENEKFTFEDNIEFLKEIKINE